MRMLSWMGLLPAICLLAGCGWFHHQHPSAPAPVPDSAPVIVTPAQTAAAHVLSVNASGRFVILNFAGGQPLPAGRYLAIYRKGLKNAEVKVSGPQQDDNTVADILSGEARKGDEAREE